MPTPVPEEVTEEWLVYGPALKMAKESTYWGRPVRINGYLSLPLEARDKAARLLYEHLTEAQVTQLRTTGMFVVGRYVIISDMGLDRRSSLEGHPGYKRGNAGDARCIQFGYDHELIPMCDRMLALKLALEDGQHIRGT